MNIVRTDTPLDGIPFRKLKVGETFIVNNRYDTAVYLKVPFYKGADSNSYVNAVDLTYNNLARCNDDELVIKVNHKLTWEEASK